MSTKHNKPLSNQGFNPVKQDLDLYWDQGMADILETWGEGNVWDEIQFLIANLNGKVIDVACGTGKTIEILSKFLSVDLYGCDISDFLISKAKKRKIPASKLKICDATDTDYADSYFDYAYSIGSLEHFTEEGVMKLISEVCRITKYNSFHQIPVSRDGKDHGWVKTKQSFFNNSVSWWLSKFESIYDKVIVLDSKWEDSISVGKWFLCFKTSLIEEPPHSK